MQDPGGAGGDAVRRFFGLSVVGRPRDVWKRCAVTENRQTENRRTPFQSYSSATRVCRIRWPRGRLTSSERWMLPMAVMRDWISSFVMVGRGA